MISLNTRKENLKHIRKLSYESRAEIYSEELQDAQEVTDEIFKKMKSERSVQNQKLILELLESKQEWEKIKYFAYSDYSGV